MAQWTYIKGTITVSPMGQTQPEKRYILDTVLSHLPKISSAGEDMTVHVIQAAGYDCSSSCDEFGQRSNLGYNEYGSTYMMFPVQSEYILVVEAALRHYSLNATLREFSNWLCRLSKRVLVTDILVKVSDAWEEKDYLLTDATCWHDMFEKPSWVNDTNVPNWCEYLMWDRAKESSLPITLAYKYYRDPENDKEAKHRLTYLKESDE